MVERWALVLGGADCVWEDLRALENLYGKHWDNLVIAVNDVACHWPRRLHHWVSLHPNRFKKWTSQRHANLLAAVEDEHHHPVRWGRPARFDSERLYYDRELDEKCAGSSGMFAVQVARRIECTRVILCGVPMTATGHFRDSQEEFPHRWGSAHSLWPAWERTEPAMRGWVRSMSGRTRDLLGYPTREWLETDCSPIQSTCAC